MVDYGQHVRVSVIRGEVLRSRGRRNPSSGGTFVRSWEAVGEGVPLPHPCAFALRKENGKVPVLSGAGVGGERGLRQRNPNRRGASSDAKSNPKDRVILSDLSAGEDSSPPKARPIRTDEASPLRYSTAARPQRPIPRGAVSRQESGHDGGIASLIRPQAQITVTC